jgi:IMP dehydrogenase/GMP reductase
LTSAAFLTKAFGVELPIIQAPMAGVQNSALAIAVANAGGLGSIWRRGSLPHSCTRKSQQSGQPPTGRSTSISSATKRRPLTCLVSNSGGHACNRITTNCK